MKFPGALRSTTGRNPQLQKNGTIIRQSPGEDPKISVERKEPIGRAGKVLQASVKGPSVQTPVAHTTRELLRPPPHGPRQLGSVRHGAKPASPPPVRLGVMSQDRSTRHCGILLHPTTGPG
ncbi:hypothetical protein NDU88_003755 [Pleurodeles waltl]|uniref:Uncharacterized protein n=1 Tax=Pleurodeles waltl TaxID=8319 RepID=A0AAV7WS68_PLEWA|nr:hypothetical protein NDU88_003755 [Pleurodeles waltl]